MNTGRRAKFPAADARPPGVGPYLNIAVATAFEQARMESARRAAGARPPPGALRADSACGSFVAPYPAPWPACT
jgi:hypothetical protein